MAASTFIQVCIRCRKKSIGERGCKSSGPPDWPWVQFEFHFIKTHALSLSLTESVFLFLTPVPWAKRKHGWVRMWISLYHHQPYTHTQTGRRLWHSLKVIAHLILIPIFIFILILAQCSLPPSPDTGCYWHKEFHPLANWDALSLSLSLPHPTSLVNHRHS